MKPFNQILSEARFRIFACEMQEAGVHKNVDDFYTSETHCVIVFKKNTPKVLLKELQFLFKQNVSLFESNGINQIIYTYAV